MKGLWSEKHQKSGIPDCAFRNVVMISTYMNIAPENKHHALLRRYVWFLTPPFAGICWYVHTLVRDPQIASEMAVIAPAASILAGFGVAMVVVMAIFRRAQWRFHLRFQFKRLILALALSAITPVAFLAIFPFFGWIIWANLALDAMSGSIPATDLPMVITSALWSAATVVFWYIASGLIISTITTSKLRRGFVFCLSLICYSALVFLMNTYPFNL